MIESSAAADDTIGEVAEAAALDRLTCISVTIFLVATAEELEGDDDLSSRELIHTVSLGRTIEDLALTLSLSRLPTPTHYCSPLSIERRTSTRLW